MKFTQLIFLLATICFSNHVFAQPGTITPVAVTASNNNSSNPPSNAFDNNVNTVWSAGDFAQQYIQADLGKNYSISQIRLNVAQTPNGPTTHQIYVALTVDTLRLIGTLNKRTDDGEWLEFNNSASNVRYIRIHTVDSPSWVAWREIKVYKGAERGLQYFGYFASAMSGVGNGNYTAEISNHSNVTWIASGTSAEHAAKLQEAEQLEMKAVMDVSRVFFNYPSFTLKDNFESEWINYANQIQPYINSVAAFYPLDEPFLPSKNRPREDLKRDLEIIISTIRQKFPDKLTGVIFSYLELQNTALVIPSGYDWIGFDCYPQELGGNFNNCHGQPIQWYVDTIKAKLKPGQRMFLVPEGVFFGTDAALASAYQPTLVSRSDEFFRLAQSDPVFIGMFTFIYQSHYTGGENWFGTRDLPLVKTKYQQIGRSITNK